VEVAGRALAEAGARALAQLWRPDPSRHLSILFDVFALGQRTRTLLQTAMRGCGIRPDEYAAYSVLFEAGPDGRTARGITMTEMARQLGMPVTTAADYVRSMQSRGHLRRDAHPGDGRAFMLRLTPAGLRAHRKASAAVDRAYQALRAELGELDEEQVRTTLRALAGCAERAVTAI
jgi:DNA-binding MarR family transcriptional regulator